MIKLVIANWADIAGEDISFGVDYELDLKTAVNFFEKSGYGDEEDVQVAIAYADSDYTIVALLAGDGIVVSHWSGYLDGVAEHALSENGGDVISPIMLAHRMMNQVREEYYTTSEFLNEHHLASAFRENWLKAAEECSEEDNNWAIELDDESSLGQILNLES